MCGAGTVREALSFYSRAHAAEPLAILPTLHKYYGCRGPGIRREQGWFPGGWGLGPGDLNQCQRRERGATWLLLMIVLLQVQEKQKAGGAGLGD